MVPPFRDDAAWRTHRAAELEAERERLQRDRDANEARIVAIQRSRLKAAIRRAWTLLGATVIVVALAGGYVVGRWALSEAARACE